MQFVTMKHTQNILRSNDCYHIFLRCPITIPFKMEYVVRMTIAYMAQYMDS